MIEAGALPREYCGMADGLLLSGGYDVDPAYFGETAPDGCELKIQPERDTAELGLFSAFFAADKPILGICRGMQLINVAAGGSLIADIPLQTGGDHMDRTHRVDFEPGSRLFDLLGASVQTNSFHHQAVKDAGSGIVICGRSEDGIAEAIEHKERPVFGVQFHPERMERMNILFSHLVHLCMKV